MAKIIEVFALHGHLWQKTSTESRDCWRCVHIEEAMGDTPPRVCEECIWSGKGAPGPKFTGEWIEPVKDNYVARKDGRFGESEYGRRKP